MASWMVHLRVADGLLPRLKKADETAFVVGNIAPDSGVPNEDWSEFRPPKTLTHFKTRPDDRTFIDAEYFREIHLDEKHLSGYGIRELSFFLGYYAHLLTDVLWIDEIIPSLKKDFPREYGEDMEKLIRDAKEDWYDLDYLYLEHHPDFRAFSVYENAVGFENVFMDMFAADAFENRRKYICGFYRSGEHRDLYREYRYLTPERVNLFVRETAERVLERFRSLPARGEYNDFLR